MVHGNETDQGQAIPTIVVVGVGLIGGSIGAAIKERAMALSGRVLGVGRDIGRLEQARAAGLIDEATDNLAEAAARASLIVFCTPVDRIVDDVREAAPHCRRGTLLTDAGSVKGAICRGVAAIDLPDGVTFIGSHPLAGSEKRGFEHADADLFDGRVCVMTPTEGTCREEASRLQRFWEALGMTVVEMSPEVHDRALAQTSHLPHVVAAALAANLSDDNRTLAATGFADTTRIAAGDPDLWIAILLSNAETVLSSLDDYAARLAEFRSAIASRDPAALKKLLELAKTNRDALSGPAGLEDKG